MLTRLQTLWRGCKRFGEFSPFSIHLIIKMSTLSFRPSQYASADGPSHNHVNRFLFVNGPKLDRRDLGDQMSLTKNFPKCSPTIFIKINTVENSSLLLSATFLIFKKLPKVNNSPRGENLTVLVTLGQTVVMAFVTVGCSH
jgi:hypothetical protein